MAKRSAVELLPAEVRGELDRRLVASAFGGYESLSDWLAEQGFEIGKSSIHRYGQKFEERCSALKIATDQAKAIVAESPDDEGAMNDALMRLVQEKLFSVMLDIEVDPSKANLSGMARAIAELGRASVSQKKWQTEMRGKVQAAAESVTAAAKKGGLSDEALDTIKRQILGIAA